MAESSRHQKIKSEVAKFFEKEGWKTTKEARGDGWRADCLVEKDGRRAAIEVELSKPSLNKILPRIETYEQGGTTSLWLINKNSRFPSRGDLPIFPIEETARGEMVYLDRYSAVPLADFISALARKKLKRRVPHLQRERAGAMILFGYECYSCKKEMSIWGGALLSRCACGRDFEAYMSLPEKVYEREVKKRWDQLRSPFGPPAFYKKSATSMRHVPYLAAHCPHCSRLQGEFYVSGAVSRMVCQEDIFSPSTDREVHFLPAEVTGDEHLREIEGYYRREAVRHWCLEKVF